jgi:hypothetical protein
MHMYIRGGSIFCFISCRSARHHSLLTSKWFHLQITRPGNCYKRKSGGLYYGSRNTSHDIGNRREIWCSSSNKRITVVYYNFNIIPKKIANLARGGARRAALALCWRLIPLPAVNHARAQFAHAPCAMSSPWPVSVARITLPYKVMVQSSRTYWHPIRRLSHHALYVYPSPELRNVKFPADLLEDPAG